MSMTDDPNGFRSGRGGGRQPTDARRAQQRYRDEQDWRRPDPQERYAGDYQSSAQDYGRETDYYGAADDQRYQTDEAAQYRYSSPQEPAYSESPTQGTESQSEGYGWEQSSDPHPDNRREDYANTPSRDDFFSDMAQRAHTQNYDDPNRYQYDESAQHHQAYADPAGHRYEQGDYAHDDYARLEHGYGASETAPAGNPQGEQDWFFSETADQQSEEFYSSEPAQRGADIYELNARRSAAAQPAPPAEDDPFGWEDAEEERRSPPPASMRSAHPPAARGYAEAADADYYADEDDRGSAYDDRQQPKRGRKAMVAGVLMGAIAVGGGAAYLYKNMEGGDGASLVPPTLTANGRSAKVAPSDPGGKDFPHRGKQIYERLSSNPTPASQDGTGSTQGAGQSGAYQTASAGPDSIPGIGVTTTPASGNETLEDRIQAALKRAGQSGDTTASQPSDPNAPRAVRTMVVRPDGTVEAPPARPSSAGIVTTTGSTTPAADETQASEQPAQVRVETIQPEPARVARLSAPEADQSQQPVVRPSPSASSASGYFVQVAARRDQTDALAAFADLQQKYPKILTNLTPTIKKADLGDKGVWYRLWIGPLETKDRASDVCKDLKSAGMKSCFVRSE